MSIKRIAPAKEQSASALITALIFILVVSALVCVGLRVTSTVGRISDSSRDFANLRYEAEGALDVAYGIWLTAANAKYGPPASTDIPARVRGPSPSSPPTFNYPYANAAGNLQINCTDSYGTPIASGSIPTAVPVYLASYPGWQGLDYSYTCSVRLTSTNVGDKTASYGVKRSIEYVDVPLFQAMAFFQGDLELYKPATMTVQGLVHTNGDLYASVQSPSVLTFLSDLSYVGSYYTTSLYPTGAASWSAPSSMVGPTYPSGQAAQVHQVDAMQPLGTDPASVFAAGNPNTDSMRFLVEPPNTSYTDPAALSGRRLYNKAGIIITISGTTKTITTQNGVTLTSAQRTTLLGALTQQTIYDTREGANVGVTSLNIATADPVFNAASGFSLNGVLYIYDSGDTTASEKAIRLTNGTVLPTGGLTVASENGVYIQGDYNVGSEASYLSVPTNLASTSQTTSTSPTVAGYTRAPSAVMADAVTILSNAWSDSNSSKAISSRVAQDTTINTAIVAGNVPSGYVNPNTGVTYGYSGGFNNFPRFLEDWTGQALCYYGSMVQLFNSAQFIGQWNTSPIYLPPNRFWNYDSNFLTNPPPGSLDVVNWTRGALTRW